jgi:hypothetical protein
MMASCPCSSGAPKVEICQNYSSSSFTSQSVGGDELFKQSFATKLLPCRWSSRRGEWERDSRSVEERRTTTPYIEGEQPLVGASTSPLIM